MFDKKILKELCFWYMLKAQGREVFWEIGKQFKDSLLEYTDEVNLITPFPPEEDTSIMNNWTAFISFILPQILDPPERFHGSTDEIEKKLLGLSPPADYYLSDNPEERYHVFLKSLEYHCDILIFEVLNYNIETKEFLCRVVCFAEKKRRWIDDFNFCVFMKRGEVPPSVKIKIGSYFRGLLHDSDIVTRKLYICMNLCKSIENLPDTVMSVIEANDFPLHYKLLHEKPVNSLDSYIGLGEYKIPDLLLNHSRAFNLNPYKFSSFYPEINEINTKKTCSVTFVHYKTMFSCDFFSKGKKFFEDKNIEESLKAFEKGFIYNPDNIQAIMNRAAVHGNVCEYAKARKDLEYCLSRSPNNIRALQYLYNICMIEAEELEKKKDYLGASNAYATLLSLEKFYVHFDKESEYVMKQYIINLTKFHMNSLSNMENVSDISDESQNSESECSEDETFLRGPCLRPWLHNEESTSQSAFISEDRETPIIELGRSRRKSHKKHKRYHRHKSSRSSRRSSSSRSNALRVHSRSPERRPRSLEKRRYRSKSRSLERHRRRSNSRSSRTRSRHHHYSRYSRSPSPRYRYYSRGSSSSSSVRYGRSHSPYNSP